MFMPAARQWWVHRNEVERDALQGLSVKADGGELLQLWAHHSPEPSEQLSAWGQPLEVRATGAPWARPSPRAVPGEPRDPRRIWALGSRWHLSQVPCLTHDAQRWQGHCRGIRQQGTHIAMWGVLKHTCVCVPGTRAQEGIYRTGHESSGGQGVAGGGCLCPQSDAWLPHAPPLLHSLFPEHLLCARSCARGLASTVSQARMVLSLVSSQYREGSR